MKKYFLDKRYRKVTHRVCIVLSTIAGIIALLSTGTDEVVTGFAFIVAIGVWLLYGAIRWILAALPEK